MKMLAIIAWAGWGVLLAALLVGLIMVSFERHHGPEVSRGMGPLVIGALLVMLLCAGGLLYWFTLKQWQAGVIVMAVLFWWPGLLMAARPIVLAVKAQRWAREEARAADMQTVTPAPGAGETGSHD